MNNPHQNWKNIYFKKKKRKSTQVTHNLDNDEATNMKDIYISNQLKNEIKKARISHQITQKQLSDLMSVRIEVIQSYEDGTAIPKTSFIHKLQRTLNTNFSTFK